ncbi:hypothetical protein NPIL_546201 [Nephila pilipes]|uniref:Uncharacterized protein n=1 Tax=Nephila pilipes TaxID=299642 RepID=A0A8X6TMK1_NEPPI|nr:hypothetical protein NPIL_546201 [Nephila pilipes]
MDEKVIEKAILLVWFLFSIRFLFFSYWDILFLPPILIILDGLFKENIKKEEQQRGDKSPLGIGAQKDNQIQERLKHSIDLDRLITKLMEEEKRKAIKKTTKKKTYLETTQ